MVVVVKFLITVELTTVVAGADVVEVTVELNEVVLVSMAVLLATDFVVDCGVEVVGDWEVEEFVAADAFLAVVGVEIFAKVEFVATASVVVETLAVVFCVVVAAAAAVVAEVLDEFNGEDDVVGTKYAVAENV